MTITDFTGALAVKGRYGRHVETRHEVAFGGSLSASGSYSTAESVDAPRLKLKADIVHASFARTFDELELIQKIVPLFQKTGGDYSMSLRPRRPHEIGHEHRLLNRFRKLRAETCVAFGETP